MHFPLRAKKDRRYVTVLHAGRNCKRKNRALREMTRESRGARRGTCSRACTRAASRDWSAARPYPHVGVRCACTCSYCAPLCAPSRKGLLYRAGARGGCRAAVILAPSFPFVYLGPIIKMAAVSGRAHWPTGPPGSVVLLAPASPSPSSLTLASLLPFSSATLSTYSLAPSFSLACSSSRNSLHCTPAISEWVCAMRLRCIMDGRVTLRGTNLPIRTISRACWLSSRECVRHCAPAQRKLEALAD